MERVQLNLERLLPELRDLEKKKIFTRVRLEHTLKKSAYRPATKLTPFACSAERDR
jgi:hypothetical protein